MKIRAIFLSAITLLLLAGCSSTKNPGEERFLTEREQKAALAKIKSPQYFGFHAFPSQGGIDYRGYARLHPNHQADVKFEKGQPVVKVRGRAPRMKADMLLDFSSPYSWMDYATAAEFGATFMGMNDMPIPYRGLFAGDVKAYAAVISQLRIDPLFIENLPLYVRMSTGSVGPFARSIYDPNIDMVMGYDVLGLFETIQLNLRDEQIILSSSHPYRPSEDLLMSRARILRQEGYGLVVQGAIFGKPTPIVLDIVGEYHFMRSGKMQATTKQVSIGDVVYRNVPTMQIPLQTGLPRAGRLMLEKYQITICPSQGFVYFERYPEN